MKEKKKLLSCFTNVRSNKCDKLERNKIRETDSICILESDNFLLMVKKLNCDSEYIIKLNVYYAYLLFSSPFGNLCPVNFQDRKF